VLCFIPEKSPADPAGSLSCAPPELKESSSITLSAPLATSSAARLSWTWRGVAPVIAVRTTPTRNARMLDYVASRVELHGKKDARQYATQL